MIIYVDLVFFLNVILDFILLMSISVILVRNIHIKKIIIGSVIGGVSTFILFVNLNSILISFFKIILGIIMILVTFGFHNFKEFFDEIFYLFILSFILSGTLYLFYNNGLYNYFILIILFVIVCFLYIKQMKKFKTNYSNNYKVDIYIKNKKYALNGYLDTGNKLYDPYHNRPIILIDKRIPYQLEEIIYVPYTSLNNKSIVKCLKTDKIIINNKIYRNYLVGLSNIKFKIDNVNCILHSQMKGNL